ncbi:chitinase 2-like [Cucumis melo]|nr:chitinase 2-like [Cucumis melo]
MAAGPANVFREYIGAEFNNVKFSDVPIRSNIEEFHFLLSFAIDFDASSRSFTNGAFDVFWDSDNLNPSAVASIKKDHSNVRVGVSLGGDTVDNGGFVFFKPSSIHSWVSNAEHSLTKIINTYNLDGIDIDYEHFKSDPDTFAECIGQLIKRLKKKGIISFASIAPFDDDEVQSHYLALWRSYGHLIDYVNFQFYAYDKGTTVGQFIRHFKDQVSNYEGGRVLASLASDNSAGGLVPENGFFKACRRLKREKLLDGIFIWSADDSKAKGFGYEKEAQSLLATPN